MVHLSPASQFTIGSQIRVEVAVEAPGETPRTLWFQMDGSLAPSPEAVADALFPIGLMIAMVTDGTLEMASPVSARLLDQADKIQDILLSWHGSK
ncbi:hypothetical protein I6E74_05160, partial [Salinibacterium sp. SWN139]|uniref:hypothetical protein n=1 Tax=Salinibacterium sp. SWN139 TaxID=2792055 RepID=UPI0018CF5181